MSYILTSSLHLQEGLQAQYDHDKQHFETSKLDALNTIHTLDSQLRATKEELTALKEDSQHQQHQARLQLAEKVKFMFYA